MLLFVLGLRTSIFVALSIPTSMFLSFIVLWVLGVSMNMVVLFSLILALGMLVDNAIVIVENIYRFIEEGWDRRTAAKKATGEVAAPVIAATATTLAAFTPLLFWPGMAGQFMRYLPLTLIVTLSSSLFVALVIVPTLCSLFLDPANTRPRPLNRPARLLLLCFIRHSFCFWWGSPIRLPPVLFVVTAAGLWLLHAKLLDRMGEAFMARGFPRLAQWYERRLRWALNHRALVLAGSAAALVGTIMVYGAFAAPVEYFPEDIPPGTIVVAVEAPVGTSAAVTDGYARRLKEELAGVAGIDDAETVVTTVGAGGWRRGSHGGWRSLGPRSRAHHGEHGRLPGPALRRLHHAGRDAGTGGDRPGGRRGARGPDHRRAAVGSTREHRDQRRGPAPARGPGETPPSI